MLQKLNAELSKKNLELELNSTTMQESNFKYANYFVDLAKKNTERKENMEEENSKLLQNNMELQEKNKDLIKLETELKNFAANKDLSELEKASKDEKKRERAKQKFFNNAYSKLIKQGNELQTTWESLGVDQIIVDEAHSAS